MRKRKIRKRLPISYVQFGLLILLGIMSYVAPGRLLIDIFLLTLIISMVDGIYFYLVKQKVRVNIEAGGTVSKGDLYKMQIQFKNTSYLPSALFIVHPKETEQLKLLEKQEVGILLGPKKKIDYQIVYKARLSGESLGGIYWLYMISFFGFFKVKVPLELYVKINILPKIHDIKLINQLYNLQDKNEKKYIYRQQINVQGEEMGSELRPYRIGDSEKLIHWKIAALKDDYVVRERENSSGNSADVVIVLNPLQPMTYADESAVIQDKLASSIVSIIYDSLCKGQKVKLACYFKRNWQYITLEHVSEVQKLQSLLSRYHGMPVTHNVDTKQVIKSMKQICCEEKSLCLLVTCYGDEEMKQTFIDKQEMEEKVTIIWTKKSEYAHWYLTDEFVLEEI